MDKKNYSVSRTMEAMRSRETLTKVGQSSVSFVVGCWIKNLNRFLDVGVSRKQLRRALRKEHKSALSSSRSNLLH